MSQSFCYFCHNIHPIVAGCEPYACDAFEQAIIDTGAAQLFPLDDADTETIIPVDGILNSLGTPIVVDGAELYLIVEASSRGKDWLDPASNAVGARAIGGDLTDQTCSTYGTYFRTGVWASAINNTPTPAEMNSFGGYIWNLHTGTYSGLFNVAYGIEWSFTGQTTRRIEFINFTVQVADKATNTVRVSYDNASDEAVIDTAIVDMAADESFWWHLDVDLTMGTPSAGAVPLTSTWTLYINGQSVMLQAGYTRNFVNLNTSQPVFFRSYNGDGSLPGYVIPSRITLPHDELHALNYYIGLDLDVADLLAGYQRNFTNYYPGDECFTAGCEPYNCAAFEQALLIDVDHLWYTAENSDGKIDRVGDWDLVPFNVGVQPTYFTTNGSLLDECDAGAGMWEHDYTTGTFPIRYTGGGTDNGAVTENGNWKSYAVEPGADVGIGVASIGIVTGGVNNNPIVFEMFYGTLYTGGTESDKRSAITMSHNGTDFTVAVSGAPSGGSINYTAAQDDVILWQFVHKLGVFDGTGNPGLAGHTQMHVDVYANTVLLGTIYGNVFETSAPYGGERYVGPTWTQNPFNMFTNGWTLYFSYAYVGTTDQAALERIQSAYNRNFSTYTLPAECN